MTARSSALDQGTVSVGRAVSGGPGDLQGAGALGGQLLDFVSNAWPAPLQRLVPGLLARAILGLGVSARSEPR